MEGGLFEYAPSAEAVVRSFEYAGQTESIVDKSGNNYTLFEDKHEHLMLGHSLGKADIDRLRDAWQSAQREDPRRYPLVRVMPDSDAGFLTTLFEVLEETVVAAEAGWTWKARQPGRTSRCESLDAVNVLLLKAGDLRETAVQDPYGHLYRPHRVSRGPLALADRHYLEYRDEFPGDVSDP